MKIIKLAYGLTAAAMLALTSCSLNDQPKFNDADAFVAFNSSSLQVGEAAGTLEIPVMLTSLKGVNATVSFEVIPDESTPAVEGINYTIEGEKTITFTKDAPTQYIKLNIIDNDTFDGNVKFTIALAENDQVNLGANKTCTVNIEDDEHPLLFILGNYSTSQDDYWGDHYDWTITIARDDDDINKVWLYNLDPYFASYGYVAPSYNCFYGIVNDDKTEIRVPVGQAVGYKSGDQDITLEAFSDADADVELTAGESIVIEIQDNGATLKFATPWWGLKAYNGYWCLYGGTVFTKD